MKIIYSIIIVSFLCLNCFGQISFQKLYKMNDSIHWDEGVSVQQNISTGGYLISGTTFNNVSSRASIILINTNNYGDTTSTYTYEADTALLFCVGTKELSSGDNITAGYVNYHSVFLMKTDALGNIVWFKTYYNNASTQVVTTSFQETSDGGFILTGYSYSAHHSIFLIKTDANGNLIFDKNYNYNGDDIFGNYVIQTSDGNYVVTGYIDIAGDGPLFLMKVDTMGNLLWQKSIGGLYSDWGYCVRQTNDGGFIIAGITYAYALPGGVTDQIYLVKTDNNGTLQWSRKMGCMGNDDGYSVIQTNDNGYLITGTTTGCAPIGFEEHNIFLIKTDSSGAEQWSKLYGTGGNSSEYGYDVIRTTDEGYIVVGNTNGPNNDNNQIYVIKTDSNGNSGCNEISFPISDSTYISFDSIININVVQANLIAGSETIKIYRGCKTTALCTSEGINEYSNEKFLTISPNPFTSLTTIYFSTEQTNTTIKITDILGKEIKALNFTGKLCTLEKGTMQAGIYFVQITDANKNVVNRKVVVQ